MTINRLCIWVITGLGMTLLAAVFQLYRNPLLEMYLANWSLC